MALGQDSEPIREVGYIVLRILVKSLNWFMSLKFDNVRQYLERHSGVVLDNLVCCSIIINGFEDSV
jgi:hypothetical protein